ncbi:cohesin domain-containing protein [Desulfococcaceae bacterium HSG8]|nr:cohesin domain-containing protein [Desulfococcaceae bacterium HSG8]
MNRISLKLTHVIVWIVASLLLTSAVWGTELFIPPLKAKPGQTIEVPLKVDTVDNLAGFKVVMKYDINILTFKKAAKTKQTSSLMHIVNDKKPGTLIAVMAGARGIKGKDFSLLSLNFEVKKGLTGNHTTKIEITKVEMMSDQLKDVKCSIKSNPITIAGGTEAKKAKGNDEKKDNLKTPASDKVEKEKQKSDAPGKEVKSGEKCEKKAGQDTPASDTTEKKSDVPPEKVKAEGKEIPKK